MEGDGGREEEGRGKSRCGKGLEIETILGEGGAWRDRGSMNDWVGRQLWEHDDQGNDVFDGNDGLAIGRAGSYILNGLYVWDEGLMARYTDIWRLALGGWFCIFRRYTYTDVATASVSEHMFILGSGNFEIRS